MLYGQPPFAPNSTEPSESKNIHAMALKCDLSSLDTDAAWRDASHEVKDLIRKTIVVDPLKRLDIGGVRRHPWFDRYREELGELYKHACHDWVRRESPVEWIDIVEGSEGKVVNRTLGESFAAPIPFGGYQHEREHQQPIPLQVVAESDENSRSGLENGIGRFRIDSAAGCVMDSPRIVEHNVEGKMEGCEPNFLVNKVDKQREARTRYGSRGSRNGNKRGSRGGRNRSGHVGGCRSGDVQSFNPGRGRGKATAGRSRV